MNQRQFSSNPQAMAHLRHDMSNHHSAHFQWQVEGKLGLVTINRPEKKNPLTFDSYAGLRDLFRKLQHANDIKVVIISGAGGNFCSGGNVHEIIGPLIGMNMPELLEFTRMTGDLVKAMRNCPQPIISAIDGICAGAGAMIALGSDLRLGTPRARTAFLFNRVGLAGCDMGACALLPRMIGQGRASELLYTGVGRTLGMGRSPRPRMPSPGERTAKENRPRRVSKYAIYLLHRRRRRGHRTGGEHAGGAHLRGDRTAFPAAQQRSRQGAAGFSASEGVRADDSTA